MSGVLPSEALKEFLLRDERFWQKAHPLFDRVRSFISHNLHVEEYRDETEDVLFAKSAHREARIP